jgi:hypothetical protein
MSLSVQSTNQSIAMKKLLALQYVDIIEIFQMTELHEPHGWLFDTRLKEFERQKQLRQQQQEQEEKVLLNEALDHLRQEHPIILQSFVTNIADNYSPEIE